MIHVLIERRIADDMESTYEMEARKAIQCTYQAPGFISGETFRDLKHHNRRYVMSKWRTLQDWQNWKHSAARKEIIDRLNPILEEQERITVMQN